MKKFVLYILFIFSFLFLFTSCSTPQPGSYDWDKKYGNSGIARHRSCGASNGKVKKGMKPEYKKIKKKKNNKKTKKAKQENKNKKKK